MASSENPPSNDVPMNERGDDFEDTDDAVETPCTRKRKESRDSGSISTKKTRSKMWEHYTRQKNNYDKCNCNYCGREMSCPTKSGTSSLKKHIDFCCKAYRAWKAANRDNNQTVLSPTGEDEKLGLGKVSELVFREASHEMLVLGELPLAFIESVAWKHFTSKCKLHTPHSRRTATTDIVDMYVSRKAKMMEILATSSDCL
ncbi:uncharacterized protein LOC112084632 [Eutrema salsugineum]|uniref:uncharacterized protein LOC112084632 n=1 Tax=Eutrema salsugineum TaxID=72664 RepID=UPI000CED38AD|nr:uncharacterized protein LOC112084632 [Eutrema salsugineum]